MVKVVVVEVVDVVTAVSHVFMQFAREKKSDAKVVPLSRAVAEIVVQRGECCTIALSSATAEIVVQRGELSFSVAKCNSVRRFNIQCMGNCHSVGQNVFSVWGIIIQCGELSFSVPNGQSVR